MRSPVLLNRAAVFQFLTEDVSRRRDAGETVAVLFVDLDGLKPLNDNYGHEVGDAAILTTAMALMFATEPCDVVGRLGGDEFLVVLCHRHSCRSDDGAPADSAEHRPSHHLGGRNHFGVGGQRGHRPGAVRPRHRPDGARPASRRGHVRSEEGRSRCPGPVASLASFAARRRAAWSQRGNRSRGARTGGSRVELTSRRSSSPRLRRRRPAVVRSPRIGRPHRSTHPPPTGRR